MVRPHPPDHKRSANRSKTLEEAIRRGALQANPKLSRFNALSRIIYFDDFDSSPLSGFVEQVGNFRHDLETSGDVYSGLQMGFVPPANSSLSVADGSLGSIDGGQALILRTYPEREHLSKCTKRVTLGGAGGRLQMESWFSFGTLGSSDRQLPLAGVRSVGFNFDLQDEHERWWPAVRYLQSVDGEVVERWQWHAAGVRHPYLDGWIDIEGAQQPLGASHPTTTGAWHYLRWSVDLAKREYVELQCNDLTFDLSGKRWVNRSLHREELHFTPYMAGVQPTIPSVWGLLNIGPFVQTDTDLSSYIAIDSFLLSAEW